MCCRRKVLTRAINPGLGLPGVEMIDDGECMGFILTGLAACGHDVVQPTDLGLNRFLAKTRIKAHDA